MPTISMFYGIIIALFYGDDGQHHAPHLHARYQKHKAAISIPDGIVLAGSLPPRQLRMVQVWIDLHHEELLADWELVCSDEPPFRIPPLQ